MRFSLTGAVGTAAAGVDGPAAGVCKRPPEGAGLSKEMLGIGTRVFNPLCETSCAVKNRIPTGRATMLTTKTAATIHQVRAAGRCLQRLAELRAAVGQRWRAVVGEPKVRPICWATDFLSLRMRVPSRPAAAPAPEFGLRDRPQNSSTECSHTEIGPNRSFVFGSFCIVSDLANRQILLRRRPSALVEPGDTELSPRRHPSPPTARRWSAPRTSASTPRCGPGSTTNRATFRRCSWERSFGRPASARSCRRDATPFKSVT